MEKIALQDLVMKEGATAIADRLGCSVPAITKALKNKRQVFVDVADDGTLSAKEIKNFPSPHHIGKSASAA